MSASLVFTLVLAFGSAVRAEPGFVDSFPVYLVDSGAGFQCGGGDCGSYVYGEVAYARWLLREVQAAGDEPCCLLLEPHPAEVQVKVIEDEDLTSIDSEDKLQRLFDLGRGIYIVPDLSYCEGPDPTVIGCAPIPGNAAVVEYDTSPGQMGQTIAHERGHNAGLEHRGDGSCALMASETVSSYDNGCLETNECKAFERFGTRAGECPPSLLAFHFPNLPNVQAVGQASAGGDAILAIQPLGRWSRADGLKDLPASDPYSAYLPGGQTISLDGETIGGTLNGYGTADSSLPAIWRESIGRWSGVGPSEYSDYFYADWGGEIADFSPNSSSAVGVVPERTVDTLPPSSHHIVARAFITTPSSEVFLPFLSTSGPLSDDEASSVRPVAILNDGRVFGELRYVLRGHTDTWSGRLPENFVWTPGNSVLTPVSGIPLGTLHAVSDDGQVFLLSVQSDRWLRYDASTGEQILGELGCWFGSMSADGNAILFTCDDGRGVRIWRKGIGVRSLTQFLAEIGAESYLYDLWHLNAAARQVSSSPYYGGQATRPFLVAPGELSFDPSTEVLYGLMHGGMFVLPLEGGPGGGGGGGSGTATLSITKFRTRVWEGGGWPVELAWSEGRWSLSGNFPGPDELSISGTYVEVGKRGRKLKLALDTASVEVLTDYMETDIAENLNEVVDLGPGREPMITLKLGSNGKVRLAFSWRLDVSPSNALRGPVRWKLKGKGTVN